MKHTSDLKDFIFVPSDIGEEECGIMCACNGGGASPKPEERSFFDSRLVNDDKPVTGVAIATQLEDGTWVGGAVDSNNDGWKE